MPTLEQRNFAGGEVSPSLEGRKDLKQYAACLKSCRNMVVTKQGSLRKRPGLSLVTSLENRTHALVPFVFNESQSYLLVFEGMFDPIPTGVWIPPTPTFGQARTQVYLEDTRPTWCHVFYRGSRISLVGTTAAYDAGHTYAKNDVVESGGNYYWSLADANTAHPLADTAWWEVYNYVRLPHTYTTSQLKRMKWVQAGDVLTIAEVGTRPQQIRRVDHEVWTIGDAPLPVRHDHSVTALAVASWDVDALANNFPKAQSWDWQVVPVVKYTEGNAVSWIEQRGTPRVLVSKTVALQPGSTSPVGLTWTKPAGLADADVRYRIYRGRYGVMGLVGESDTNAFTDQGLEPTWEDAPIVPLEQDDNLLIDTNKAPAAVAYFEQRMAFAGSNLSPTTLWLSRVASFSTFGLSFPPLGSALASDGKSLKLEAYHQEQIRALLPGRHLLAFTTSSVWGITSDDASPVGLAARQHAQVGIGDLPPLQIGGSVLFVGHLNDAVFELGFSNETAGYEARELSFLASHLFAGQTLVDWTHQRRPESIVWAVRSDGALLGLTYAPEAGVRAWHHHDTEGTFEAIETVPEDGIDVVYAVVRRRLANTPAYAAWSGATTYAAGDRVSSGGMWWESAQAANTNHEPGAPGSESWWNRLDLPGTLTYVLEKMGFQDDLTDYREAVHLDYASVVSSRINTDETCRARLFAPTDDWVNGLRVQFEKAPGYVPIVGDIITLRMAAREARGPGDVALDDGYARLTVTNVASDTNYDVSLTAGDTQPFQDAAGSTDPWAAWVTDWDLARTSNYNPGAWPGNGLTKPPVVYADGTPLEAATNYAVPAAAVVITGMPFTAEVEFLDPVVPGTGNHVKKINRFGIEYLGAGEPAVGIDLDNLAAEVAATTPTATPQLVRQVITRIVASEYGLESKGALRQANPYPLTILGVLREVELGGK